MEKIQINHCGNFWRTSRRNFEDISEILRETQGEIGEFLRNIAGGTSTEISRRQNPGKNAI